MFKLTRKGNGPILSPDSALPWENEGVFNPGIAPVKDEIVMLYRAIGERESYISHLGLAKSKDGITFERAQSRPVFGPSETYDRWATEDPRVTPLGDDFYITYVAVPERVMVDGKAPERNGPLQTSTALLKTKDFISFEKLGIISPAGSDNKDIVIFPEKIKGKYFMLHRPNLWTKELLEREHFPKLPSIWTAYSDDLAHWTGHKPLFSPADNNDARIGPGIPPLRTRAGWLLIYHHVTRAFEGEGFTYTARAALLDIDNPERLIAKLPYDILVPEKPYEIEGNMKIVFPTGGYIDEGTLNVYYGASDRFIGLATGNLEELLIELEKHTL